MSDTITEEVLEELKIIRKDLDYIKERMVEVMSEEDSQLLEEAMQAHAKGETTSLDDV
ncbi:MAG: hypothetical protein ACE5FT_06650 [Candidatus Nanoarchaeia archaeon]